MLVSIVKLLAERICESCCHQSVSAVRIMIVVPAIPRCDHWWIVDSTALTAEPTFTRTSVEICTINSMSITDYLIHSIRLFRTSFVLFFDSEMYENDGRSNDSSRSMISQLVVKFLVLYRYSCRGVEKQPLARPAAHSFKKLFDSLVFCDSTVERGATTPRSCCTHSNNHPYASYGPILHCVQSLILILFKLYSSAMTDEGFSVVTSVDHNQRDIEQITKQRNDSKPQSGYWSFLSCMLCGGLDSEGIPLQEDEILDFAGSVEEIVGVEVNEILGMEVEDLLGVELSEFTSLYIPYAFNRN